MFVLPLVLATACILFVRLALGFQFPVPWPDETGFVAPAFDFARTASFFDPGMNPDRVVMWMPPGYMLLLAAVFRVFGYSFALARWVSAFACIAAMAAVARLGWRLTSGWQRVLVAWIIAASFISPFMLIDANIARMEMPFAAVMLLGLSAAVEERYYIALAVVVAGGLIHFNGLYFVPPVLLGMAASALGGRMSRPQLTDCLALIAAGLGWALYVVYVALNWPGFETDMAMQFRIKQFSAYDDPAHPLWFVLAGAALALFAAWQQRRNAGALIALFGASFLIMAHEGHELWYDYGQPLGLAMVALALLMDPAITGFRPHRMKAWVAGMAAVLVLGAIACGRITPALRPLLPHMAMLHRNIVAPGEIARVRTFIAGLPPGATVDFGWTGMELFFLNDLARAGAQWTIIRHSVTESLPFRASDWRVVCDSSEWPLFTIGFDIGYPRHRLDTGCKIIRTRPPTAQ